MTKSELKKKTASLTDAWLFLNDQKEIFQFLTALFSESELLEFQNRLDIAARIYYWKSYTEIEKELGVSSTTIAKVSKAMQERNSGYPLLLGRMYNQE